MSSELEITQRLQQMMLPRDEDMRAKPISVERLFATIESLLIGVDAGRALSDTR